MNKSAVILIATIFIALSCQMNNPKTAVKVFEPNEESLIQNYSYPEWFRDAKFGIYTHWGPVTYALQYSDRQFGWYGRLMYMKTSPAFEYHKKYFGDQNEVGYKDVIKRFTAPKFDAEEWARIFADAGAKFAGPVAVHHDNYLMWDSDVSPWNSADVGPKRDISGELEKAIRSQGMKFMGSFHHGFSYRYYENVFDYDGEEAPMLYGPKHEAMPAETRDTPPWKKIPRDYQELFLEKVQEFTGRYHPDLIYYDFGMGWHDEDIKLKMYSDFYNESILNGQPQPTVAQKERRGNQLKYSTLDLERGRMSMLTEYPWLTDDSPGSWFYYPNPKLQTANTMIDRFVDIVSKNGCLLLNVGPDHEGLIPVEFKNILNEYGKWLKINGEGIYNTRPWYAYGEGVTSSHSGHNSAANSKVKNAGGYTTEDIRYTQSKDHKTLYAFVLDWSENQTFHFKALKAEKTTNDASVELMGLGKVPYSINADGSVVVNLENTNVKELNLTHSLGFKLQGFKTSWQPFGHFLLPNASHVPASEFNFTKNEIRIPIYLKHAKKGYEIALVTKADNTEELNIPVKLIDKESGEQVGDFIASPKKAGKFYVLGEISNVNNKGAYELILDLKNVTDLPKIEELAATVKRDQTILKIGDTID